VFHTIRLSREHRASGIFRYYLQTIITRTGLTMKQVAASLQELAAPKPGETIGWILYDDAILWVVNGLRYDPHISLANPHHFTTVKNELAELPHRKIVLTYCDYYKVPYPFEWVEPTHSQQDSDSESKDSESKESKDPEEETTTSSTSLAPLGGSQWPSPESLQALYNEQAPEYLPRVTTLNDQRRAKAKTYLARYPQKSWWEEVFAEYRLSRFLLGMERSNGHENFKPDFDWLLSAGRGGKLDNCVKVHDGKYRDGSQRRLLSEKTQGNLAVVARFVKGEVTRG
jgi:hypothetical protein